MTHKPESDVEPAVAEWFEERHGADAVERQVYLEEPRWYCDIVVDLGAVVLYIEVENDAASVRDGLAQALGYAATDDAGLGMVVTPADHADETRVELLRRTTSAVIREFDTERGEFVPAGDDRMTASTQH